MRKAVLVLALFLVIPVLSNAGSISSRYDVTFGGFVKYDLGWSSQNQNADPDIALRQSGRWERRADEYGNTFQTAGETGFNFLIKGPDLWGAKTSAFIEGDFRGVSTGNSYGGFQLRHAFMSLNWESAELMFGQNWQQRFLLEKFRNIRRGLSDGFRYFCSVILVVNKRSVRQRHVRLPEV